MRWNQSQINCKYKFIDKYKGVRIAAVYHSETFKGTIFVTTVNKIEELEAIYKEKSCKIVSRGGCALCSIYMTNFITFT